MRLQVGKLTRKAPSRIIEMIVIFFLKKISVNILDKIIKYHQINRKVSGIKIRVII